MEYENGDDDLGQALDNEEDQEAEQNQNIANDNIVLTPYADQSRWMTLSDFYKYVQPNSPMLLAIWSGANFYATCDQFLRVWKEHEDSMPYATIPGPFFFATGFGLGMHAMNNPNNDNSNAALLRRIWITINEAGSVVLLWLIGEGIQIYLISCKRNAENECDSSNSLFWELFFAPSMAVSSVYMIWELIPFQWKERWIIPDSHTPSWMDFFKRWGTLLTETIMKTLFYSRIFERLMQVAFCNDALQRQCIVAEPLIYEIAAVPSGLLVVSGLYFIKHRNYRVIPKSLLFYLNVGLQSYAFFLHSKDELNSNITQWPAIVKIGSYGLCVASGTGFIVYQYSQLKKENKKIAVITGPEHEWFQRQTQQQYNEAVERRVQEKEWIAGEVFYDVPLNEDNSNVEKDSRKIQDETRIISISRGGNLSSAGDLRTPLTLAYNSQIKHATNLRKLEEANSRPVEVKPSRKRWSCKDMCVIS